MGLEEWELGNTVEDSRLGREGELGLGLVIERRIKVRTCGGNGGGVSWKTLPASCGKNFRAAYHQINLSKGWARSWYAAPPQKKFGPRGPPAGWRNYHGTKDGLDIGPGQDGWMVLSSGSGLG